MQENKGKIDRELLFRYLKGSRSEGKENIIHHWLDNAETEHELTEESIRFWQGINPDQNIPDYNGDLILDRIHHKIKIEEGTFQSKTTPRIIFVSYLTRIAAILVIPLIMISGLLFFQNRSFGKTLSWTEIFAPYGARTNFCLPDGSKGFLNSGSSLKFPTQFDHKVRQVKLTGEAYFDVISNQKQPFIVSTENIDIKVTGTSFNVMAYANEQITEVTLERGRIEVFNKRNGANKSMGVLKPDELFSYNSVLDSGKIQSINSAIKLSWLSGKLAFKYEPFDEVIRKLNRWYNVDITIQDKSLSSYIYYGTFQNETLDEVLKLLQYTSPIKYKDYERQKRPDGTFEKRRIEIYSKRGDI